MLNPSLYQALRARFRDVRVANEGQPAHYEPRLGSSMQVERAIRGGEYYYVCCPHCGDTRFRLWISYLFNTLDAGGKPLRHLYHCFNEGCDRRGLNLYEELQLYALRMTSVESQPVEVRQRSRAVLHSPGRCRLLTELPEGHPALVYVRSRGFDPLWLVQRFSVSLCYEPYTWCNDVMQQMVHERLIFPIVFGGKVIGWQARYVGVDASGKPPSKRIPKYFTAPGFHKSQYLYNYDAVASPEYSGYGLVVEGVMDVVRMPYAVCPFGSTLTMTQMELLWNVFHERAVVLLFDRDKFDEARRYADQMGGKSNFRGGVAVVRLPDSRDPAEWRRDDLEEYIAAEASRQNVDLSLRVGA